MTELNNLIDNISNIKNDITNALVQKNASFTDFASYPGAIENIKTGGGVYQYDSLENMYADISNRSNGDIAVVYSSTIDSLTENTTFQEVLFPKEVVLNSAPRTSRSMQFRVNPNIEAMVEGLRGAFSRLEFYLYGSGTFYNYDIEYTTNDGLNYTLNTVIRNKRVDSDTIAIFDKPLKFYSSGSGSTKWVDDLGKFIKVRNITFDGIYKYNGTNFILINTQLTANKENVWNSEFYGNNGIQNGSLQQVTNLNLQQLKDRVNLYSNLNYLNLNENSNNLAALFINCKNLINIPNFNTDNVVSMGHMFAYCTNLINVPNFNTSNVTEMSSMFWNCKNLTNIPNFNTSKVIRIAGLAAYTNISSIPNFDTSNVIDMGSMFLFCNNLIEVPNFDTSNVTEMDWMFGRCNNLAIIPQFNTSNVTNMLYMFSFCNNLTNASVQNIVNMCLNSNVLSNQRNLNPNNEFSPLYNTKFNSSYYSNRLDELIAAGWTY